MDNLAKWARSYLGENKIGIVQTETQKLKKIKNQIKELKLIIAFLVFGLDRTPHPQPLLATALQVSLPV